MYTAFIVFEILGFVFFGISTFCNADNKDGIITLMAISCLCFCVGGICFMSDNTPSAMDVYQGRTTLEITYKDGISVDSIVVFKHK